jgi:hypothetical protein
MKDSNFLNFTEGDCPVLPATGTASIGRVWPSSLCHVKGIAQAVLLPFLKPATLITAATLSLSLGFSVGYVTLEVISTLDPKTLDLSKRRIPIDA